MSSQENSLVHMHEASVQPCLLPEWAGKKINIDVLRLDKIHPIISGNKWFKLKYHVKYAVEHQFRSILTYGGPWSNHIMATACIARLSGLQSVGVIRGEIPGDLSTTLLAARSYGMELEFVSRGVYSHKNADQLTTFLLKKFENPYMVPEGGAGSLGVLGSKEILSLTSKSKYSHIICCIGTGTMYAGIVQSSLDQQEIMGISVLKGIRYTPTQFVQNHQKELQCKIFTDYHFGGYAKKTPELIQFMNYFYSETGIPSDFVYTGKLFFACRDLVLNDYFPAGSRILVIHSGGLQGNASLPKGTLLF